MTMPNINRRRLLDAMGLTAGTLFLPSLIGDKAAYAQGAPKRLLIYSTQHGPVWERWAMNRGNMPATADWEFPLDNPDPASFSDILRPLHPYRQDLLVLDGLSYTSAWSQTIDNNHGLAGRHKLTGAIDGTLRVSVDQAVADLVSVAGRFKYLYYANGSCDCDASSPIYDTAGKQVQPGRLGASNYMVGALNRVFGTGTMAPPTGPATPAELSRLNRQTSLAMVRDQYTALLAKLGAEDRAKLTRHRDMISDLEKQVLALASIKCERPGAPATGLPNTKIGELTLSQLYPTAMACDLTRVAIATGVQLDTADIGAPAGLDVHQDIAHAAGNPTSANGNYMTNYYAFHAAQFAKAIAAFKSVPEGNGTMLDNSLLVWIPELATGGHDLHRVMVVLAGRAGGAFHPGRYVKYAETGANPAPYNNNQRLGPPHNKLLVSILQAFGSTRTSFGLTTATGNRGTGGGTIDLGGPLPRV